MHTSTVISAFRSAAIAAIAFVTVTAHAGEPVQLRVTYAKDVASGPITGRLIVAISRTAEPEPRRLLNILRSPAAFGIDVDAVKPGTPMTVDSSAAAYPLENLTKLPAGDYFVQALLIPYMQVRRSDGHTLWVPAAAPLPVPRLPGNLFSKVERVRLDPAQGFNVELQLTNVIAPETNDPDTEWLRTVRIKSKILSDFWGTPMYLGARVLLPRGFAKRKDVRYPALYVFGHGTPFFFDPDPAKHEPALARARAANLQTGYEFYKTWSGDDFPRVVGISPIIPSPYALESYAINSANQGPWGDAITQELIPYLEKEFRLIAKPYARIVEGASTGGWEALALQLHYPDLFGGAWVFNPDSIDFRRYQLADLYQDANIFSIPTTDWTTTERPYKRNTEGQLLWTFRQGAQLEAVLGSKGRSGDQLDIWQATHGPVGADGYPVPLFDKKTGVIDRKVVDYMREHGFDLTEYARRNWSTLGPKLNGKLNFFAGEQDDFYLNLGVYNFEEMLREQTNPKAVARFEYGRPKKGHNWHLTDFSDMVREMAAHVEKSAPAGESSKQWRY